MENLELVVITFLIGLSGTAITWLITQRAKVDAWIQRRTPSEIQDVLERAAGMTFDALEQIKRKAENMSPEEIREIAYPIMKALIVYLGGKTPNEEVLRGGIEARVWKENRIDQLTRS